MSFQPTVLSIIVSDYSLTMAGSKKRLLHHLEQETWLDLTVPGTCSLFYGDAAY